MKLTTARKAAITVAYADVFDAVLTADEVLYWSVGGIARLPETLPGIRRVQYRGKTYLCRRGRNHLVTERTRRERIAEAKWKRIRLIAAAFRLVPTLLLVGVTGGLSMNNARLSDDIDLFFITRRGTLWITRLMVIAVAEVLRMRRRPDDVRVRDKVCLNMFMAEDALALPHAERDLFSAHEVLQMKPVWDRDAAYKRFLTSNAWVGAYLPVAWNGIRHSVTGVRSGRSSVIAMLFSTIEPLAKVLQLTYMSRRRTSEVIRSGQMRFHPTDAREWIRQRLAQRLRAWDIPLDSVFYHR